MLTIGDVRDFQGAVRKALSDGLRKRGAHLSEQQWEEAFAFLSLKGWEEWKRFDPWHDAIYERSFSTFLYRRLSTWRLDEWFRSEMGDARYGQNVITEELHDEDREQIASEVQFAEVLETINTALLSPLAQRTFNDVAWPLYVDHKPLALIAAEQNREPRELKQLLEHLGKEIERRCLMAT